MATVPRKFTLCMCVCVKRFTEYRLTDKLMCVHKQKTNTHKTMNSHSTKQCHSVTQVLYLKSRYANISAVGALYITGNFFLGMSSVSSVTGQVLMSTTLLASCKCPNILKISANNVFCHHYEMVAKEKKMFHF